MHPSAARTEAMMYFSRWKTAAIQLTALITCLFVVPDFVAQRVVRTWPAWSQRRLVLGLDLQGGSHLLLEIDANALRKAMVGRLADNARRLLREAGVRYRDLGTSDDGVELHVSNADLQRSLSKLRELSQPLSGLLARTGERSAEITELGEGRVRIAPTQAAVNERIHQAVQQSVQIV